MHHKDVIKAMAENGGREDEFLKTPYAHKRSQENMVCWSSSTQSKNHILDLEHIKTLLCMQDRAKILYEKYFWKHITKMFHVYDNWCCQTRTFANINVRKNYFFQCLIFRPSYFFQEFSRSTFSSTFKLKNSVVFNNINCL